MSGRPLHLVILGRQGSGKGTQCVRLFEHYGTLHVSTGDMLRAAVRGDERIADDVCILDPGKVALDVSLDRLREQYRQVDAMFETLPPGGAFDIEGVESVRARGQRLSVLTSANADAVVERARGLSASSIQVAPVGLREIFLEKVKDALV